MADYLGRTFEFVNKSEYKPIKKQVDDIIRKLQGSLKKHNVTFDPKLIGSAGRHLVTRIVNGNKGFDFDYNFVLQKDGGLKAKQLRLLFKEELDNVLLNTNYSSASEGKQSLTIKIVNREQSRINHSCDFAIVREYFDNNDDFFQDILIWDKQNDNYIWNKRPYGINYTEKLSNLKENGLWEEVKEEYLKLKNNNSDENKKSFVLFYEAVHNVYNSYEWV